MNKLEQLTCKRCGQSWLPRTPDPIQCPRCKSLAWNREEKE